MLYLLSHLREMAEARFADGDILLEEDLEVRIFIEIIKDGKLEELEEMLDRLPGLAHYDFEDEDVITPLHFAVKNNRLDMCKAFLKRKSNVNVQSREDFTSPLHLSADTKVSTEVMQVLVNAGANIEAKDAIDCTALNLLFMEPGRPEHDFQYEKLKLLLKAGACVSTSAAYGTQPLHGAVCIYHAKELEQVHDEEPMPLCVQVAKMLLDYGADVNCINNSLQTPLHFATCGSCPLVVQLLLEKGAKVDCRNSNGVTPLENIARHTTPPLSGGYASRERFLLNRINCLDLLLSYGATVKSQNDLGETALHWLVSRPSSTTVNVLEAFLTRGANPNAKTTRLQAPLHYVCIACKEKADRDQATEEILRELVQMLVSHGADLELKDINGHTPLALSIIRCDLKLATVLVRKGARRDSLDKFGRTLHHTMQIEGVAENLKVLLAADAETAKVQDAFGLEAREYKLADQPDMKNDAVEGDADADELQDELLAAVMAIIQPKNSQLNVKEHIRMLKDQIEDIDQFCSEKLTAFGIGEVVMTKEFSCIQGEVDTLINRVASAVREEDKRMAFTPVLSGSMSEGTKIGTLNEFDYLLYMNAVSDMCEVMESPVPGFVYVSGKDLPTEQINDIFRETDRALIANIFREYLYTLIQKVLGRQETWDSLHFYWDRGPLFPLLGPGSVSNLVVQWAGIENNGLKISIDLAPVIHKKSWLPRHLKEKSSLLRIPFRAFGTLIVISKEAPEHETFEGGNEKYLRLSYSHIEKEILLSLPEHKKKAYVLAKVLVSDDVLRSLRPVEIRGAKLRVSSYILKMALFTLLEKAEETREDEVVSHDLPLTRIRKLASNMFHYIDECIKHSNLPSFFLPKQNILRYHERISINDRKICNILCNLLQ